MSDIDVISRKDVLNMAYLSVFVDSDGHEVDEPRYVIDASDVERLSAVEQPMSAVEYEETLVRMRHVQPMPEELYLAEKAIANYQARKAVAIVENWAREHPEET